MATTVTDQIRGITISEAVKAPVLTVATTNITLSGLQTLNSIVLAAGDRVLCVSQTDGADNGIYEASTSTWQRAPDFDGNNDVVQGTIILVNNGGTVGTIYEVTNVNPIVIGTTEIDIVQRYGANTVYDRTTAEIAAGVTPTNTLYPPGHFYRYGGSAANAAAANDTALAKMLLIAPDHDCKVPSGIYQVSAAQVLQDFSTINCDADSNFYFDDGGAGTYFLTNGVAGVRGGYCRITNLSIILRTVTAKGVKLINSIKSVFDALYVEGKIPDNWPTGITTRTNIGLFITASGEDSFWNTFNSLHINHCHTGVYCDVGPTQQFFNGLFLFGDAIYGDTQARGLVAVGCQDSVINGGYIEAYDDTSGYGGICLSGTSAVRWKIRDVVFDQAPAVTMNAVVIEDSGGDPSENQFTGCTFGTGTTVLDGSEAADANYLEGRPDQPGGTWTATLTPGTSGSITLNSGVGGDTCYARVKGREVEIEGVLTVASVSSPVGTLTLGGLPFTVMNNNGARVPVTIRVDLLQATGATHFQAYANRNSTSIFIERFASGVASTATAADFKANSEIYFQCKYTRA